MSIPKDIIKDHPYLDTDTIIIGYRGSIAHGTYRPNSNPNSIDDKDVMAIVIPPITHYFGLEQFGHRGTKDLFIGEWDIVTYEFKKFISLLTKGNPNVLSLLWLDDTLYIKRTEAGQRLIDHRNLFVSKQVYHSFTGYAYGQLKRMTHFKYEGYMGTKRKALVDKFGFDTKNSAALIMILRQGIEFLNEGTLYVRRKDAKQLLEIKDGEWSLEQIKKEAEYLFKRAEAAYDNCKLPNECNKEKIDELCVDILSNHFKE